MHEATAPPRRGTKADVARRACRRLRSTRLPRQCGWTSAAGALLVAAWMAAPRLAYAAPDAAVAGAGAGITWVRPGRPVPAPGLWVPVAPYAWVNSWPGTCLPGGWCAWGAWRDDFPRRPVAPEPAQPTRNELWDYGSTWGYLQRLPPATPEGHIQPRFRDASTVRPEFVGSGRPAATP